MEDEDGWNHDRYIVPDIVLRQCQGLFLYRGESKFWFAKEFDNCVQFESPLEHNLKIRSIYYMLNTGAHIFIMRRKLK